MSSSGPEASVTKVSSKEDRKQKAGGTDPGDGGSEGQCYITEIKSTDILCGRGHKIIQHQGNRDFRDLVSTRKAEYVKTGRYKVKDQIARQIVDEIASRNGRFLRKVSTLDEAKKLGVPKGVEAWVIAEDSVSLEKTKQALRDKDPVKAVASSSETSDSANIGSEQASHADAAGSSSHAQLLSALVNLQSQRTSAEISSSLQLPPTDNNRQHSQWTVDLLSKLQQSQSQQQQLPTTQIGSLASLLLPQRSVEQQPFRSQELMYLQHLEQQTNAAREQQQQLNLRNLVDTARRQAGIQQLSLDNLLSLQMLDLIASRARSAETPLPQNPLLQQSQQRPTSINPFFLGGLSTLAQTSNSAISLESIQERLSQHRNPLPFISNAPRPLVSTQDQSPRTGPLNLLIGRRLSSSLAGNPILQSAIAEDQKCITDELKDDQSKDEAGKTQDRGKNKAKQQQKRPRTDSS